MSSEEIPGDVRAFVRDHVPSVGHMETLALLYEGRERAWSSAEASGRLYVPISQAEAFLGDLAADGLVERSGPAEWRFTGASTPLHGLAERTIELYRQRLVPMTRLIHARADAARQLSDAFRFRRD